MEDFQPEEVAAHGGIRGGVEGGGVGEMEGRQVGLGPVAMGPVGMKSPPGFREHPGGLGERTMAKPDLVEELGER